MSKKPTPLTQGDVTGECVIYSALNAVRWLWPEHFGELEACEKLYGELVGRMEAEGLKSMMVEGTESDAAYETALRMAILLEDRGLRLNVSRMGGQPEKHHEVFNYVFRQSLARQNVADQGSCAVIGLDEPWNHWSVVVRSTRTTLTFFDSYGPARLKTLPWSDFTTGNAALDKIQIDAPATVIYRRLDVRTA